MHVCYQGFDWTEEVINIQNQTAELLNYMLAADVSSVGSDNSCCPFVPEVCKIIVFWQTWWESRHAYKHG